MFSVSLPKMRFEIYYSILGALSLIPLFVDFDLHLQGTPLEASVKNWAVLITFAACAGVAVPICVDVYLDRLIPIVHKLAFSRLVLALSLCVPFFVCIFAQSARTYYLLMFSQRIFA